MAGILLKDRVDGGLRAGLNDRRRRRMMGWPLDALQAVRKTPPAGLQQAGWRIRRRADLTE